MKRAPRTILLALLALSIVGVFQSSSAVAGWGRHFHYRPFGRPAHFFYGHRFRHHFYRPSFVYRRHFYHRPHVYRPFFHHHYVRPYYVRSYAHYYRPRVYYVRPYYYVRPVIHAPVISVPRVHYWFGSNESSSTNYVLASRATATTRVSLNSTKTPTSALTADHHGVTGSGWKYLAAGRANSAMTAFAKQSAQFPHQAGPKIGYALAAAKLGDMATSSWAMQRAYRIDASAFEKIKMDDGLQRVVSQMIVKLESHRSSTAMRHERALLLGSLYYLTGNHAASRKSLLIAGETDPGVKHLLRLVEKKERAEIAARSLLVPEPSLVLRNADEAAVVATLPTSLDR